MRILGLSLQAADCKLTKALTTLGLVILVNIHPENWLLYFFACGNVMQGHGHIPENGM